MLKNDYLLAKIGADTAENERKFAKKMTTTRQHGSSPGMAGALMWISKVFPLDTSARSEGIEGSGYSTWNCFETNFIKFCWVFAEFWKARSRLYQNENLQENMRSTAFFKLYKICILLHRCNLNILAKNRFEKSAFFVKIQQN